MVRQYVKHTACELKPYMEGKPPKTIAAVALFWVIQLTSHDEALKKNAINRIALDVDITKQTIQNNARKVQKLRRKVLP